MPTTRLPNGVTTLDVTHIHNDLRLPYAPQFHTHMEEMDVFIFKTAGSAGSEPWDVKLDANGIIAAEDGENGIVQLAIISTPTQAAQMQYAVSDIMPDAPELHFSAGFSINTAITAGDFSIGLAENVGNNFFSPTAQGYYFIIEGGVMKFVIVGPSGTTTFADLLTLTVNEFISVQFHRDDTSQIFSIGINGVVVERVPIDSIENIPDVDLLCFSGMAILNTGVVYIADIDFMWLSNERGYIT